MFFYNPTTRLSMWDRPEELIGRADVDKNIQEPPHKRGLEDSRKTGSGNTPTGSLFCVKALRQVRV